MLPAKLLALTLCVPCLAADVALSRRADRESPMNADPSDDFWRDAPAVTIKASAMGKPVGPLATEVRARWTGRNLYFLFRCPYQTLYLKPGPVTDKETNQLWDWDVAEIFIGADFKNIRRYREFEVSPQGEWVDLDIDLDVKSPAEKGWLWNSGFANKTRIDRSAKVWYTEMRIPVESIDAGPAREGKEYRINFYRVEGGPPNRIDMAWQPTHTRTFHTPAAFGILRLAP